MRLLITGGAGFVGARLARALLARGRLQGRCIERIVLADQAAAPSWLLADARVEGRVGTLLAQAQALHDEAFDAVFHLASAVSGECELDFELGLRSNLDSTRALLDALRARVQQRGVTPARLVFASSIAVFGPDPAYPFPALVGDDTLPTPQTSYGTHKLVCEQLIADYTRKGFVDGRAARLVTVTVRPGRPNGAASSFFSGIIREPLAGVTAPLPVDPTVAHPVASVQRMVEGLIAVAEASREALVGRTAITLPGLNVTVQQMLDALERVAGPAVRARVVPQPDAHIAGIVANWPRGVVTHRAAALGLRPEASFDDIIRSYIADCRDPVLGNPAALRGMSSGAVLGGTGGRATY
ncbi:MAG: D-erythronate dehydrogenase [Rubrivivax sp.]